MRRKGAIHNPTKKEKANTKKRKSSPVEIKKKIKYHPGTVALREIKKYQKMQTRLTAKVPFIRKVKEILMSLDPEFRVKRLSMEALREATEDFLTDVLSDANLCAIHGRRITVMVKDVALASRIRGDTNRLAF